jgi:hypothetical protein
MRRSFTGIVTDQISLDCRFAGGHRGRRIG